MSEVAATIVLVAVLLSVTLLTEAMRTVPRWHRLRSVRLVTCPETNAPAAVSINGMSAAINVVFNTPCLRLSACSRWPSRRLCDQACLRHVEATSDAALVRVIAGRWFAGKKCVYCRQPIASVRQEPALLGRDGTTQVWTDVPPEQLSALFCTDRPVCCHCHLAETFRRLHPELVTDR